MQEGSAAPGPPDPAAGLGRRNPTNQDAFHRIDPNLAARVGASRSLFTFAARPAPCRLPRAGPASSKADRSLQTILTRPRALSRAERGRGKMPLSDFCNRLTTTCTQHGPSDSRVCLLPAQPLAGRRPSSGTDLPSVVGPPADPRVERRLTATLQLQPSPTTRSRRASGAWTPSARVEEGPTRSWRSCDRQLLRAVPPGRGVLSREPSS